MFLSGRLLVLTTPVRLRRLTFARRPALSSPPGLPQLVDERGNFPRRKFRQAAAGGCCRAAPASAGSLELAAVLPLYPTISLC